MLKVQLTMASVAVQSVDRRKVVVSAKSIDNFEIFVSINNELSTN